MTRWLLAGTMLVLALVCLPTLGAEKKQEKKPAKQVFIDPDNAGPDYAVQGEYLGETTEKAKWGAEVIARGGNGNFEVKFLPGGLRGEGGDYAKHIDATAKTEGDKTTVASKDGKWTAAISGRKMTGKAGDVSFTLEKVIRKSKTLGEKPPSGAVVLFDGKLGEEWPKGKLTAGNLEGTDIASKSKFKDHTLHIEFRLSFMPTEKDQGRSNSGVYVQHRYEVQVLDSFGLKGENNECGGVYTLAKPLVNMCYPPLTWQTYDIDFTAAKFTDGKRTAKAKISVRHNGVLIHDNVELDKPTGGGQPEADTPGPVFLQGHGGQVQYRNIWVVEKK